MSVSTHPVSAHSVNTIVPNRAVYVNNVIPADLCEETIQKIETTHKFQSCKLNDNYDQVMRNSSEVKISDTNLTNKFWTYIAEYIPIMYDNTKLIGPDYNRVYLLKYEKGQFFKRHYDGYSEDSNGNRSRLTVMVYLNSVKNGGSTRFYRESDVCDVIPDVGKLLIFEHRLLHEGMQVLEGFKYCIRFNILYQNAFEMISNATALPTTNGLKYTNVKMSFQNQEIILTPNRNDKMSKARWDDVCLRPHVFQIKHEFPGFVDTTMGRPPTWEEDFCPNCYEILPIKNDYQKCSGCSSVIEHINKEQRKICLSLVM